MDNNNTNNQVTNVSFFKTILSFPFSLIIVVLLLTVVAILLLFVLHKQSPIKNTTTNNTNITTHNNISSVNNTQRIGGIVSAWTPTSELPTNVNPLNLITYNGYVYEIGGENSANSSATVYYAPINSNGTIGLWNTTTALPQEIGFATNVAYKGYVYEIGGNNGISDVYSSTIYYAPINSNGTLGSWNTTTSLPQGSGFATSVAYNNYIYNIGGRISIYNSQYNSDTTAVYYAPINNDGTIGSWLATTALPQGISGATSVVYNRYMYEIGGEESGTNTSFSSVYYAPINSNGTIGSWTTTTTLPQVTTGATSIEYNGYLYEIGGGDLDGTSFSSVYYAPINSNGTIGSWISTTPIPQATKCTANSFGYNGDVYVIGQCNAPNFSLVYYASLAK